MGSELVLARDTVELGGRKVPNHAAPGMVPSIVKALEKGVLDQSEGTREVFVDKFRTDAKDLHPGERAVMVASDALEDGRVLVDLHTVLIGNGMPAGHESPPALAFSYPAMPHIFARVYSGGKVIDYAARHKGTRIKDVIYTLTEGTSGRKTDPWVTFGSARPPFPVEVRREFGKRLDDPKEKDLIVLWEGDWTRVSASPTPRPRIHFDPALLERVEGSLFIVRAVWDLTALEAAALKPGPS